MKPWQEKKLEKLTSYFEPKKDVLALILFGSSRHLEAQCDYWSDIDILMVVKANEIEKYFPTVDWVSDFGRVYTYDQSSDHFKYTTRVCFENFQRIDFVITTGENLAKMGNWSGNPLSSGIKILFSRSGIVDRIVHQLPQKQDFSLISEDQFQVMVREFRYKSMLTVYKVVRNDLLIALHLALDLIRDCSVLGMMLRDRTEGTNIHKRGGIGNPLVEQLEQFPKSFTSMGILDIVEQSNILFEKLACEWSPDYQENRQPMLDWVGKARVELQSS